MMFLYACTLIGGATIDGKPVRHNTIKEYLKEASLYLKTVGLRKADPCKDIDDADEWFAPTKKLLADFKRWESEPDRVSPVTSRMIRTLEKLIDDTPKNKQWPDSKYHAFLDWSVVNLNMGYRKCEWATDNAPKTIEDYPKHYADFEGDKGYYNCIGDDFRLCDRNGLPFPIEEEDNLKASDIAAATIRVRYQKNGKNGETLNFPRNPTNPRFDVPMAMLRIKQRARRFGLSGQQPLSVYRANKGSRLPSFFCNSIIKNMLQMMAANTYGIDVTKLREYGLRYTGHSFRVGGAVLMHANGALEDAIKLRLRWTSACYSLYLRQMPKDAIEHMRMFNNSDVDDWDPTTLTAPTELAVN